MKNVVIISAAVVIGGLTVSSLYLANKMGIFDRDDSADYLKYES